MQALTNMRRRSSILISAALVLGLFGIVKIVSIFGSTPILEQTDELLGLQYRYLFPLLGSFEVIAAMCIGLLLPERSAAWLLLTITLSFLAYHFIGAMFKVNAFCPCLGNAASWVPWVGAHDEQVTRAVTFYLLVSAIWYLYAYSVRSDFK